jgi:hypothetical protein
VAVLAPITAAELDAFRADLEGWLPSRATVQRDASLAAPADPYGHAPPPSWQPHLADVPCRMWEVDATTAVEPVEHHNLRHRLAVPHGTDVRATDRVTSVLDAAGVERVLDAPLRIDAVLPRASHLELRLSEVSW